MDHRSARRRQPALLAILLPVVLVAACGGTGASPNPPGSPGSPLTGSSTGPSLAPAQPAPTIHTPPPPDETDPLALAELGPVSAPAPPFTVITQNGDPTSGTTTVGAAGGTVATPGGTSLVFPASALPDNTAVTVTESPVTTIGRPDGSPLAITVKPVSLVEVNLGGLEPAVPVTMTIPVATGADEVALAGHLDTATGVLTPLTILAADAASITLAVTSFPAVLTFVVPIGPLPEVVDSGFRPGTDDWQFPNYGSAVTPGGFCFGATASEYWYYTERRAGSGAAPLFGLYDNDGAGRTPGLWQDDADGIKLASMVQRDYVTNNRAGAVRVMDAAIKANQATTFAAFRSWIALTGAPQLVYADAPGGGAHAMIAYRASATRLNVADPNKPARLRSIVFNPAAGTLAPYLAGTRADGTQSSYTRFAFMARELLVSNDAMAARWSEFDAGSIGDDTFTDAVPGFAHQNLDGSYADLGPFSPVVTVPAETEWISLQYDVAQPADRTFSLVVDSSGLIGASNADLAMGENPFGIWLVRSNPGEPGLWAGYERFTAIRGEVVPTPTPDLSGEPVLITINADVPIGGKGEKATCPAEVGLSFFASGGAPGTMKGGAGLWGNCTDKAFMAIDGTGTFDGQTFRFSNGNPEYDYSGTLDGGTVTITGGPNNVTLVFPMP